MWICMKQPAWASKLASTVSLVPVLFFLIRIRVGNFLSVFLPNWLPSDMDKPCRHELFSEVGSVLCGQRATSRWLFFLAKNQAKKESRHVGGHS